jgi:hypothetical protein
MNVDKNFINGTFEKNLPRASIAPCWHSEKSDAAKELQNLLDTAKNGDYTELNKRINSYMKDDHFFRLTEGKFYEVKPGDYKPVNVKIQVKEGTITWYFANVGHDETTQEFRNQVFRTAALGHLLVPGACAKYYRGTNSMHLKRMHTSEEEAMMNHNHYRVHDDHISVSQFSQHLKGFLEAERAYGIENKFLNEEEAKVLIAEYANFDKGLDAVVGENGATLRELFHEQEQIKWSDLDIKELGDSKSIEEPCEVQEIIVPLNEKQITVETKNKTEEKISPRDWVKLRDKLDKSALDIIAKVSSAGQRSEISQTRQIKDSVLPELPNAYTKLGELFEKEVNKRYPSLQNPSHI